MGGNLCIFVKLSDPKNGRSFAVDYKFQTAYLDGTGSSLEISANTYDSVSGDLVSINEVGSSRVWRTDVDGTPTVGFNSDQSMHVCSKRGMCDYDTGLCSCFDGYSGVRCDKRSTTGIY